ncbi:DUF1579 family protein [Candidatus Bathyarchaeota archaeon]|nr:DUF1579 family protein [Candidatus Bathyarchaeota archaeon]
MSQQKQLPKEESLLKQLVGEWQVGIALKTPDGQIVSGCGEMTAEETAAGINSEVNTQIEGYEDYYENGLWSFDPVKGEVHLLIMDSDGQTHDHVGRWVDDATLELEWHGTFEDQEKEKRIQAKWVTEDQIELRETNYSQGKKLLETDYVFKRRTADSEA